MPKQIRPMRPVVAWGWGALLLAALAVCPAAAQETRRISVDSAGLEGDAESRNLGLSKNGRYATFHSQATNLVPGDTNAVEDVFLRDLRKGLTMRVSISSSGEEADAASEGGNLSANGRYAVFHSDATNLVSGDTNAAADVFVHDRKKGRTTRVSLSSTGAEADGDSRWATLSPDGRYVGFVSSATNLVPGDTNGVEDIFVHDRKDASTTRVSVSSTGAEADAGGGWVSLSKRGRWVVFQSSATTLVDDDDNGVTDVFLHDRKLARTIRMSVSPTGVEGDGESIRPVASANGRFVAFSSQATNLVPGDTNQDQDVFVYDRKQGSVTRVSVNSQGDQSEGTSYGPVISPEGRYVAFPYSDGDLAPGDTNGLADIYVHDRKKGTTTRVSLASNGAEPNSDCWRPRLSRKARKVVFYSDATNLVPGDANATFDVFQVER